MPWRAEAWACVSGLLRFPCLALSCSFLSGETGLSVIHSFQKSKKKIWETVGKQLHFSPWEHDAQITLEMYSCTVVHEGWGIGQESLTWTYKWENLLSLLDDLLQWWEGLGGLGESSGACVYFSKASNATSQNVLTDKLVKLMKSRW